MYVIIYTKPITATVRELVCLETARLSFEWLCISLLDSNLEGRIIQSSAVSKVLSD